MSNQFDKSGMAAPNHPIVHPAVERMPVGHITPQNTPGGEIRANVIVERGGRHIKD